MPVDLSSAVFALSTQNYVAEDGDVQPERDVFLAVSTLRARINKDWFAGQAIDQNVEETSKSCPQIG